MFDLLNNRKKASGFNGFFSDFLPDIDDKIIRIDIKELEDFYIFEVELPGINKNNVDVTITEDILTIAVKKISEDDEENVKYIRKERKYGTYSRSFTIPNIDNDNIKARFNNGMLILTLPKKESYTTAEKNIPIE